VDLLIGRGVERGVHPNLVLRRSVAQPATAEGYSVLLASFERSFIDAAIVDHAIARRNLIVAAHQWSATGHLVVDGSVSRLVVGLGTDATLSGTGFPFEPTLGIPIIPGSSVRGAARSWLCETDEALATRLFGTSPDSEDPQPGVVNVLDAIPASTDAVPRFVVDVVTPHHPKWASRERWPDGKDDPVPVPLVAVDSGVFRVDVVASSPATTVDDVTKARDAIVRAADDLGLGAKTSAGYGYCYLPVESAW
jgi:CRISPR-associated protein Cmr6